MTTQKTPVRPLDAGELRAQRLITTIAVVLPVLSGVLATAVMASWRADLPAEVITHWGTAGEPNGWMGVGWAILMPLFFAVGLGLLMGLMTRHSYRTGGSRGNVALLGAVSMGVPGLVSILLLATTVRQRTGPGQSDAAALTPILVIAGVWAVLTVVAGILLARIPARELGPDHEGTEPIIGLAANERAVWIGSARMRPLGEILISAVVYLPLLFIAYTLITGPGRMDAALWILALVCVILGLVSSTLAWRVRVDQTGVVARAKFGFPVFRVPLSQVASARVIDVDPTRDFGGWGLRSGGRGRFGIVLSSGPALEIRRRSGSSLVITTSDPATAAALLNALTRRAENGTA
ncbi:DUF1648 domain-containing protein [Mycetocola spongiae]|uniref:DUF1648 domain-containing protein n=1 Tax=Mycetocola spongiae TaxID=2859226 RepID=UPI001CF4BF2C|nr:DUF1648 domain-containing protein [Mycetocola spongiae]UCR89311.1 DUF1648 domain-containing protein [Mycetocola spongiae]